MNNYSTFGYDGLGRNVSILETTAGTVTTTKQFVWNAGDRNEERDVSGALTKKFFGRGQMNSATKYFYDLDHLGSIKEMADNSGVIQAQYTLDPFGRVSKISETVASDFGYAGYYLHARSGLNLTRTRSYSGVLGRFLNRDSIQEAGGDNLYAYVDNDPVSFFDPSGQAKPFVYNPCPLWALGCFLGDRFACLMFVLFCRPCKAPPPKDPDPSDETNKLGGYWKADHPVIGTPDSTHRRYHPNGDIKSIQTYDSLGKRATRFDLRDSLGRDAHRHDFVVDPANIDGKPNRDHRPLDQLPEKFNY